MKKILLLFVLVLGSITLNAQNAYRSGNKYYIDGQFMNKKSFSVNMQEKAESQLANQFSKGLKIANAGWGLFGGGIGMSIIGSVIYNNRQRGLVEDEFGNIRKNISVGAAQAGTAFILLGSAAGLSGIICLGVGYKNMHEAADVYISKKNSQPQAYLSISTNFNGLGLAINF